MEGPSHDWYLSAIAINKISRFSAQIKRHRCSFWDLERDSPGLIYTIERRVRLKNCTEKGDEKAKIPTHNIYYSLHHCWATTNGRFGIQDSPSLSSWDSFGHTNGATCSSSLAEGY